MGCWKCKGSKGNRRNGKNGARCTASSCKDAYKEYRKRCREATPTEGEAAPTAAEVMPGGMWVAWLEEILGERCCEPSKMSKKKRKNGPGSAARQQFLVRGTFLEEDGDDDDDDMDDTPDPNTFWVDKEALLETIAKGDVATALKERHEAVCGDL